MVFTFFNVGSPGGPGYGGGAGGPGKKHYSYKPGFTICVIAIVKLELASFIFMRK